VEYAPPGQSAAPPPPETQFPGSPSSGQPGPSVTERLRIYTRHPRAFAIALAFLIGFASILSSVIAWRASLASIDASRFESLAVQQQARRQQIERDLGGLIAQDLRFVNVYQEHALAARELRAQADEIRATDPVAADNLDLEAQARLDLARATEPFFLGATGATLGEDGTVTYDVAFVLRNLEEANVELRELRTARTPELASRADSRSVSLIGVAAVVVAALFFLTIAQVARTRERTRTAFMVGGAILVLIGTVSFIVVEVIA
jgi:hypothetical protein